LASQSGGGVLERNAIDLVLLDLMMPGADGAAAR